MQFSTTLKLLGLIFILIILIKAFYIYLEFIALYKLFILISNLPLLICFSGVLIYFIVNNKNILKTEFFNKYKLKLLPIPLLFLLLIFNIFTAKNYIDIEKQEKIEKIIQFKEEQKQKEEQKINDQKNLLIARNNFNNKKFDDSYSRYDDIKKRNRDLFNDIDIKNINKLDDWKKKDIENKLNEARKFKKLEQENLKTTGLKKGSGGKFSGGNLSSLSLEVWHNSDYDNRLATSADFIAKMYLEKKLKFELDFSNSDGELEKKAKELESCITNSTKEHYKILKKDTPASIAVICMILEKWI